MRSHSIAPVQITTPDGATQSFATETVTDDYRTMDLPEVPDGSEVVITPGFTKGSDKNKDHHEEGEISVQMLRSGQSANDGSTYTTFLLAANEVKSARPLGGSASFENADKQLEKLKTKKVVIEPVAGDKGRLGDIVPSNHEGSSDPNIKPERHFVTPKSNEHLTDEYATFEVNVTDEEFAQLKWADDSGGIAGATARQRKVSRSGPAKHVLKLNYKDGSEAAKLNAWVVWCVVSARHGNPDFAEFVTYSQYRIPNNDNDAWQFTFTIHPSSIIAVGGDTQNIERPALDGSNRTPPPGAAKPSPTSPGVKGDSAETKWDVSRRMKWDVSLPYGLNAGAIAPPIPLAMTTSSASYPGDDAEGNDDPNSTISLSQDGNPYKALSYKRFPHALGQISSSDTPTIPALNSWGAPGRTFSLDLDFEEFARLEIWDGKGSGINCWYRISDYSTWHHSMKTSWNGTTWADGIDDAISSSGAGNLH